MKIETEEEYKKAMSEIDEKWDEMELETLETEKGKQFSELSKAVQEYEEIHYPIPEPDEEPENIDGMTDWRETQN